METHNTLSEKESTPTSTSSTDKDVQQETESIASALQGDNNDDDGENNNDLEKAVTQRSHGEHHEAATRITTAVDWLPNDPENPLNWPLARKAYQTIAIGSLAFAVTAGSSLITPSVEEIAEHFHVSRTVAILVLSLYVLGLALGPVIAAPISETYGRSIVYKVTAPIFMLFLLGAGFSKSLPSLLICRLLAGTAGAPVLAVGAGSTADAYHTHVRAVPSAIFIMMPFLGPALGPVIGGFAAQFKGWRWTQWSSIFIALAAYALVLPIKESYKKVILTRRAKKLNIPGPPSPPVKGWAYYRLLLTITLFRPLHMLFTEPIVLFLSLYNAFTFSVLFAFFAAFPYTFTTIYHFETYQTGLAFLGILLGVLLAVVTSIAVDRAVYVPKHHAAIAKGQTVVAPEHRLYAAMAGAFGVPIGLFWFAWSAQRHDHWISPILAGVPFAWGNLTVFISTALYLIDTYGPLNGASAMAANGIARYGLGAVFPLFTVQMYQAMGVGWATSLLGFVSVLCLPIPWVFFKWGERVRGRSGYETLKVR